MSKYNFSYSATLVLGLIRTFWSLVIVVRGAAGGVFLDRVDGVEALFRGILLLMAGIGNISIGVVKTKGE